MPDAIKSPLLSTIRLLFATPMPNRTALLSVNAELPLKLMPVFAAVTNVPPLLLPPAVRFNVPAVTCTVPVLTNGIEIPVDPVPPDLRISPAFRNDDVAPPTLVIVELFVMSKSPPA